MASPVPSGTSLEDIRLRMVNRCNRMVRLMDEPRTPVFVIRGEMDLIEEAYKAWSQHPDITPHLIMEG